MGPSALIEELDMCFKAFDEIVASHGIEKIKTIGDAYLCASGIPSYTPDHAVRAVKAALEIQEWMQKKEQEMSAVSRKFFKLRVGLHCGPLVAGVVGNLKFAYDIWGDTVNTAARMEQNGETGKVNISEAMYQQVKDLFHCEYRGEIEVKNKGKQKMYFVEAPESVK
jgi:class 3 adenylate cyclase